MRKIEPPPRNLVLRDIHDNTTLTVAHSNQGDPYRQTLSLFFERGAHDSFAEYQHLASIELTADEEEKLRDLLNARHDRHKQGGISA